MEGAAKSQNADDELKQSDLIVHVVVGKLTEYDSHALEPAIADVRERGNHRWAIATL